MDKTFDYLIDIVEAALRSDTRRVEAASLSLMRSLKKSNPQVATQLQEALNLNFNGATPRSLRRMPIPTDKETSLEMATIVSPNMDKTPIFSEELTHNIEDLLMERKRMPELLKLDIRPATSILLIGPPGTGKTMLAHYIAQELNKDLVILDLSSSISNLMGKTGQNVKKVLDYAKSVGAILLLDEFDAIAKKRDDNSDLGEMKRVVNVLLMELENWPVSSMLIATSNHPELLDKAMWRRFDVLLDIPIPETKQIQQLIEQNLGSFIKNDSDGIPIISLIAEILQNKSAADICKFCNRVKKRMVLKSEGAIISLLNELEAITSDKKVKGKFCILAKEALGAKITVRQLSSITGLSIAGVQHHLSKYKLNEKEQKPDFV